MGKVRKWGLRFAAQGKMTKDMDGACSVGYWSDVEQEPSLCACFWRAYMADWCARSKEIVAGVTRGTGIWWRAC